MGAIALGVVVTFIGWMTFTVHQTWSQLDAAAGAFQVPAGFNEVARVRQGTALCFVTCTQGGEAIVTIVLSAGDLKVETACSELDRAVREVGNQVKAGPKIDAFQCNSSGSLRGDSSVWGIVAKRSDLKPLGPAGLYGPRWTEKMPIPDVPLLAWVELNSGIE